MPPPMPTITYFIMIERDSPLYACKIPPPNRANAGFRLRYFSRNLAGDMTPRQDSCQESSSAPAKEGQRLRANSIAIYLMIPASLTMSTGLLPSGCYSNEGYCSFCVAASWQIRFSKITSTCCRYCTIRSSSGRSCGSPRDLLAQFLGRMAAQKQAVEKGRLALRVLKFLQRVFDRVC